MLSQGLNVRDFGTTDFRTLELEATPEECADLAARHGLVAVKSMSITLRAKSSRSGRTLTMDGTITAEVVQTCVVTLEPFSELKEITFTRQFEEARQPGPSDTEVEIDMEADDPPDSMVNGHVDLMELIAEEVGLALDPYPRSPGAKFAPPIPEKGTMDDVDDAKASSPFSSLAQLKDKMNGN